VDKSANGPRTRDDKRRRLASAASDLTYAHGFGQVSLADIAEAAGVPLGNVYYYFKTKTAIGEAVVAQRGEGFDYLRTLWEQAPAPADRLKAFVRSTADNRDNLVRAGCPVGSLCAELGKEDTPLAAMAANPLRQLLVWLEAQFAALGHDSAKAELALHLLAAMQGISLLANAFRDGDAVVREADYLNRWIDSM